MKDYKNYRANQLGREVFFWFVCFLGASAVIFGLYVIWALLYVLVPESRQ